MPTPSEPRDRLPTSALLKIPRQRRAQATVRAILDAAVQVLNHEEPGSFTTNRVADVAGVSVGTLYQYFANKDTLMAGVVERGLLTIEDTLRDATMSEDLPIDVMMSAGLHAVLASLEPSRPLVAQLLSTRPLNLVSMVEPRITAVVHDILLRHPHVRVRGGSASVFVAVHSTLFVILRWLADPSPWIRREDLIAATVRQSMSHLDITVRAVPAQ